LKSRGILANTIFSTIERVFFAISSLVLVPIMVSCLGLKLYGSWVLIAAITSYFSLAQFGFSSSFEKYIAEFRASNNQTALDSTVCTGFYTLLAIAAAVFLFGAALSPYVLKVIAKDEGYRRFFVFFIWYLGLSSTSLAMQIFSAVPRGFMRFDISSIIAIIARTAEFLISIILLYHSFGLAALLWASTVSTVLVFSGNVAASAFLLKRPLPLDPRRFDRQILGTMFGYGVKLQMSFFASWVTQNFDKLILGWLLNASATALYDIGSKIVSLLKQISWVLFAVLVPKSSEIHAREDLNKLRKMYETGTHFISVLGFGAVGLLFPFAFIILESWLRKPPDPGSVSVFRILLIGMMLNVTAGIGSSIIKGMGKPGIETISNSIMACCNVLLSIILCATAGLTGVAWGTSIAAIIGAGVLYYLVNREFGIANADFLKRQFVQPGLISILCALAGTMVMGLVERAGFGLNLSMIVAAAFMVLAVCASLVFYSRTGYLTLDDVRKVWNS
jgi:O-antigen/teichoic acid export membrane protein